MDYLATSIPLLVWGILCFLSGVYFTYIGFKVECYNKLVIFSFAFTILVFAISLIAHELRLLSLGNFKYIFTKIIPIGGISFLLSFPIRFILLQFKNS